MGLPGAPALLLGALAVLLGDYEGGSSHSFHALFTTVSETGHGLPYFSGVVYVDDQVYCSYDSNTRQLQPRAPWMKKVVQEDPQFVKWNTKTLEENEPLFREYLMTAMNRYNQSGDPPLGKVTRKEGYGDRETLVCQAYGFYPKEIDVTWRKDGEVRQEGTFHRSVAPYPDGTYHAWLSIEIDPKERDQYQCHVDHASLGEPLVLAWEVPVSTLGLILGCIIAVALLLLIVAGIVLACIYIRKLQDGYRTALINDRGLNSCGREIVYLGCPRLCIKGLRTVGKEWLPQKSFLAHLAERRPGPCRGKRREKRRRRRTWADSTSTVL